MLSILAFYSFIQPWIPLNILFSLIFIPILIPMELIVFFVDYVIDAWVVFICFASLSFLLSSIESPYRRTHTCIHFTFQSAIEYRYITQPCTASYPVSCTCVFVFKCCRMCVCTPLGQREQMWALCERLRIRNFKSPQINLTMFSFDWVAVSFGREKIQRKNRT